MAQIVIMTETSFPHALEDNIQISQKLLQAQFLYLQLMPQVN